MTWHNDPLSPIAAVWRDIPLWNALTIFEPYVLPQNLSVEIVAAVLFALWFITVDPIFSYLFGGWMMIGAILLWLIEDAAEY
ncbi:MAG TPA: hypothetical protein VFU22_09110 [Roseiflexaceae bacterium]|nr:hypothetical protein [Roseiflexaceae bacterium]